MQGRLLATPGNVKGVEYIANEVKRMGLVPMGDNGTYFQTVNLVERAFDDSTRLSAGSTSFTPWTDYILRVQGDGPQSLDGAQVIYGGTWGDSASLIDAAAAAGKLVVLNATQRGTTVRAFSVARSDPAVSAGSGNCRRCNGPHSSTNAAGPIVGLRSRSSRTTPRQRYPRFSTSRSAQRPRCSARTSTARSRARWV